MLLSERSWSRSWADGCGGGGCCLRSLGPRSGTASHSPAPLQRCRLREAGPAPATVLHFLKGTSSGLAGAHANRELPGLPGAASGAAAAGGVGSPPPTRAITIAIRDGFLRALGTRTTLFYGAFHSRLSGVAVLGCFLVCVFFFLFFLLSSRPLQRRWEFSPGEGGGKGGRCPRVPARWAQGPLCGGDPSGVQRVHSNPVLCALRRGTPSPAALGLGISPGSSDHFDLKRFFLFPAMERI